MPIDFQAPANAGTYSLRTVDAGWSAAMRRIVDPAGSRVADIGCGGGLYSVAWARLGAAAVVGVDFSPAMAGTAGRAAADFANVEIRTGRAEATGLDGGSFDIVFQWALVHHLPDLRPAFGEAWRILRPGGRLIVQDRTLADVAAPPSPEHLRGYFFAAFPRLLALEAERRPSHAAVAAAMRETGFAGPDAFRLWETRRIYDGIDELAADLRERRGRSLRHALDDAELERLVDMVVRRLPADGTIRERDRWTVWTSAKPI